MANEKTPETGSSTLGEATRAAAQSVRESATHVSDQLKAVGVDTDVMAEAARDKAGEFQAMAAAEIRKRPFHAVALAALVGFYFGVRR